MKSLFFGIKQSRVRVGAVGGVSFGDLDPATGCSSGAGKRAKLRLDPFETAITITMATNQQTGLERHWLGEKGDI
ncbi:hypothetical protein Pelo_1284 [Pelomyxa schiedti]|nr:hypothetical protein Pelo_1284 [Pelomyxa schiedti]